MAAGDADSSRHIAKAWHVHTSIVGSLMRDHEYWPDWPDHPGKWYPTADEIIESAINLAYASGMSFEEALDLVGRLVVGYSEE